MGFLLTPDQVQSAATDDSSSTSHDTVSLDKQVGFLFLILTSSNPDSKPYSLFLNRGALIVN